MADLAKLGTYIQFDLFGIEASYYPKKPSFDFPSDAQKMDALAFLLNEARMEDRLLVSHDIHTKHRVVSTTYYSTSTLTLNTYYYTSSVRKK